MPDRFRLAVLGIDHPHGAGWRTSCEQLGDELQVVAVVPELSGATCSLEERYSSAARFDTVEQLIDWGQFDGALVCLSNRGGHPAIEALAKAGKHVLAEKPVAASADDARSMAAAVEAAGIAFQSGYMWRYDQLADRLRKMVADDRFGKLISIEMTYVTSDVRRRGLEHYLFDPSQSGDAGFFNWLACHYLDSLLYITQRKVVGVTARVGLFGAIDVPVEDGGVAVLELEGGGLATLIGGYWIPRWSGETRWCFRGSERWVHWEPARAGTGGALEIHGPMPQWNAMDETFTLPPDTASGYGGTRCLEAIRDWLAAARARGRPCRNTPASTIATLELIDTIYQASREGRRIECSIGA